MTIRAARARLCLETVASLGPDSGVVLEAEIIAGGRPLPSPQDVRAAVGRSALRGAGGAGFPVERKLAAVAAADGPRVVVANGEEGEPASAKDRWLLRHRPHLVLEGLRAAAHAVTADDCFIYLSDAEAARVIRAAASTLEWAQQVRVVLVEPAYVAGEETAVVRAIDGGEAKPLPKPPRPYESGVGKRPTLVSNVESLARLALSIRPEVAHRAGETLLLTVVTGRRAGLYEVERGTTVGEALGAAGSHTPQGVLLGGFAGGIWRPDMLDTVLSHDTLRAGGALLGCGAIVTVEPGDCPVAVAADVASYLAASSSGQCGACVRGTEVVAQRLRTIALGSGSAGDLDLLLRRAQALTGRGNCAMPDALAVLIRSLAANFDAELRAHLNEPCPVCRDLLEKDLVADTRFRVHLPERKIDEGVN